MVHHQVGYDAAKKLKERKRFTLYVKLRIALSDQFKQDSLLLFLRCC
jgi:hypothetical protein